MFCSGSSPRASLHRGWPGWVPHLSIAEIVAEPLGGTTITLDLFQARGKRCIFFGIGMCSWYWSSFLVHNVSALLTVMETTPQHIASDQDGVFTTSEFQQRASAHGIHWFFPHTSSLRSYWHKRTVAWLVEESVSLPVRRGALKAWGSTWENAVDAGKQKTTRACVCCP